MTSPRVDGDAQLLEEARDRYAAVRGRIAAACDRAGRNPEEVTLVGVAKRQPLERVLATIAAGVDVLGQSYIQEARRARPEIESALAAKAEDERRVAPALQWRMVGQLQRNKAGLAARLFDAIESVDRLALAETLSRRALEEGRELEVLVQVNLSEEPQKGGCEPDELLALAESVLGLPGLHLGGLMTVPAANPDPEAARAPFARLRGLRDSLAALEPALGRGALSMGMSNDLEVAIEEGATLVRIGTALFGERSAS